MAFRGVQRSLNFNETDILYNLRNKDEGKKTLQSGPGGKNLFIEKNFSQVGIIWCILRNGQKKPHTVRIGLRW